MSLEHLHRATSHFRISAFELGVANLVHRACSSVLSCTLAFLGGILKYEAVPFQSHFGLTLRVSLDNDQFPSCILILPTFQHALICQNPLEGSAALNN
jgi:hypothetical protein